MVLFVREEGKGREGVIGGLGVAGTVLEEVLFVGWKVLGRGWRSFSSRSLSPSLGWSYWSRWVCYGFFITTTADVVLVGFICVPYAFSKAAFLLYVLIYIVVCGNGSFHKGPGAPAASRSICVADNGISSFIRGCGLGLCRSLKNSLASLLRARGVLMSATIWGRLRLCCTPWRATSTSFRWRFRYLADVHTRCCSLLLLTI